MPSTTVSSRVSRSGAITKPTSKSYSPPQRPSAGIRARAERMLKQLQEDDPLNSLKTTQKSKSNEIQKSSHRSPSSPSSISPRRRAPSKKVAKSPGEEKRLRKYRAKPPGSFLTKLERARTQRMVVLGRTRGTVDGAPYEEIEIVGSTGNVYQVTVSREPVCTCPDSYKGNECKHKVYALHTVLRAPEHLQYQLALLTSELEDIFANAPPLPGDVCSDTNLNGKRKPADGECPICYMDLDESHNRLVWCKAQCGHNMHKSCFDQWAATRAGGQVSCVYCRAPWEMDIGDAATVKAAGAYSAEGYINVADQFGLSRARDYSGYYQPWARRHFGHGW
ncbi:hypothetical protein A1O1_01625 [Capronia coronata CBS 617.96]|uniref:Uncharacterized protein n=1 Tax=Capronia coronata CBS 617.96 TaxID=1182541 RepID=W9ZPU9_9EURO|nr:uncharacterized protein A1O1_01625 [Capronia coronata CBS 617.96]EXJ96499.1 hypothetical protein A1O1_01625 [Capronia coronata CBS 617.96]